MFHPDYRLTIQGKLYFNSLNGAASSICDELCRAGFDAEIHPPITEEKQLKIEVAIDNLMYSVAYSAHVEFKGVPQQPDYPKALEVTKAREQLLMTINDQLKFCVVVSCGLLDVPCVSNDSEDADIIANFRADVSNALPEEYCDLQEITINRDS